MNVTILGNGSGGPFHGRHYTSQVLHVGKNQFIIDCGEGAQMQIYRHRVKTDHCLQIFISHLHGDHVFGLLGLVTNWSLKKREAPLTIYSPPGLREILETVIRVCSVRMTYELIFEEVDAAVSCKVFENKKVSVWSIPLSHRNPTCGWMFREQPAPLNIRPEALDLYDIRQNFAAIRSVKAGNDLVLADGRLIESRLLTLPPAPLRSYAFCSDTMPSEKVIETVSGVDLLYHEATFADDHEEQALVSFHSTARQAARVARRAGVGRLLIGHISGRYETADRHLAEAREEFTETYLAEEGSRYAVRE
jgi:ribonuclease Z